MELGRTPRVAIALILLGCGASTSPLPPAHEASSAPNRARDDRGEQRTHAVASCRAAFAAVATESDFTVVVTSVLSACADLHVVPACREAWRTAALVPPETRLAVLAAGCQRAYCPSLAAPRPALCDRSVATMVPAELGPAWAEIEHVVLERDLGVEGATLAEGFSRLAVAIVVPAPTPTQTTGETSVTLAVGLDGRGVFVEPDGDRSRRVILALGADEAVLGAAVRSLVAHADRVVLAADSRLRYQHVVRILDAIRAAGVTRIAVSVQPGERPELRRLPP